MSRALMPFAKLIRLTHPAARGRLMAYIFESYWDDSEEDVSKYFGVGGFIGKEDAWRSLEPKWLAALPEGIDYFHATDCFSGNNQFEWQRGFDPPRRIELLDKLTDLVCETEIKLICSAVDVPYYVSLAGKRIYDNFLGNQYVACMNENIQAACVDYMQPEGELDQLETGDVCAIFYERSKYSTSVSRAITSWQEDKEVWWRSRIGNPTPGTKTGTTAIPLLQVADLGVFLGTKQIVDAKDGVIPWRPYYEKIYKAGRVWRTPRLSKQKLNFFWAIFGIQRQPKIIEDALKEVWPDDREDGVREIFRNDQAPTESLKDRVQQARGRVEETAQKEEKTS